MQKFYIFRDVTGVFVCEDNDTLDTRGTCFASPEDAADAYVGAETPYQMRSASPDLIERFFDRVGDHMENRPILREWVDDLAVVIR